jgi:hypothetical protein
MIFAGSPPQTAAYDLVWMLHVGAALVTAVALVSALAAARALASAPEGHPFPEVVTRYFTPGPEIAGRAIYLIPLTGMGLLGASKGAFNFGDPFVFVGLALWIVCAGAAEHLIFQPGSKIRRELIEPSATQGALHSMAVKLIRGVTVVISLMLVVTFLMILQP